MKLRLSTGVLIIFSMYFMFPIKLPLFQDNGSDKRSTVFLLACFGSTVNGFNPGVIFQV